MVAVRRARDPRKHKAIWQLLQQMAHLTPPQIRTKNNACHARPDLTLSDGAKTVRALRTYATVLAEREENAG